jgi:plasmid stability protein
VAQLIVRDIEETVVRALRLRAARHGRSAEAEHRAILREVLAEARERPSFKEVLAAMPDLGTDEELAPARDMARSVDW